MLDQRDYTLIIDKSDSMSTKDKDRKGTLSRWQVMQESLALTLVNKCAELDPDGITVYTFSDTFKRYENVTANQVTQIFKENKPSGCKNLAGVLQDALEDYFQRKTSGKIKQNGETMLVVTDGKPDDRKAVMKTLIEASHQMDRDEELAISFVQIGSDREATDFLKALDDELQNAGAKFDIVDTMTVEHLEKMTLTEVLLNAIHD
jgi:vWA found in TerF C terminus